MTILTVFSGGQTGADRGGLKAAKEFGLPTGGWMPKGYLALDGNHPEFGELYGVQEHPSPLYPPRTFRNVFDADGTVRFAIHFQTAGERCTLQAIEKMHKPHFDVDALDCNITPADLAAWIVAQKIEKLNVAGNSERTAPGIEEFVVAFLLETFGLLRGRTLATG